jgi:hypothetical protein
MNRKINDYTKDLQYIFNTLTINKKYKVVGSANLKPILYNSDYDLIENDKGITPNQMYQSFKNKFKIAKKDPNIYITDMKCGEKGGEPLRWSYDDIMKGKNKGIKFIDAIQMDSMNKLDIIAIIDNKITEFSDIYIFKEPKKEDEIKNLFDDFIEIVNEGNYFKALKRVFSIKSIKYPNKQPKQLLNYFNGDIGIINKCRSDLDILLLLLTEQTFRKVPLDVVKHNLQLIKYKLSSVEINFSLSDKIDNICDMINKNKIIDAITKIRDYLYDYVNKDSYNKFFKNKKKLI